MSVNVLAANLSIAVVSDAADTGAAALPLPTLYVTSGKRGETIAGAGLGKDLKTQLLSAMNDIVAGSGFIKRQLEMLQVGPRQHRRKHKPVNAAQFDAAQVNTAQVDARFRDHNGNPDLSRMLGAVLSEDVKDKSSG